MDPELEQLQANIKLLQAIHFEGMDATAMQNLSDSISEIEGEYEKAVALANDKKATEAEQKYGRDLGNAIAKSVPDIVKGALAAAAAFRKGDTIAGCAAIMDICASAIPVLSSLFAAAGPEGALVGALFSVIGQILTFFAPKQPSLVEQIDKLLANYEAELKVADMKGVGYSIAGYTAKLRLTCKAMPKVLALPLKTEANANEFRRQMEALEIGLELGQQRLNAPAFETWKVAGWLTMTENQAKQRWPEVLGTWCQAYTDLVSANMMFDCLANPKTVSELLAATSETNKTTLPDLPPLAKDHVHTLLLRLQALTTAFSDDWKVWNNVALGVLKETMPAARDRGMYSMAADDQWFYDATGQKGNLPWNYKKNTGWMKRLTVVVPKGYVGSLTPKYDAFLSVTSGVSRHVLDPLQGDLSDGVPLTNDSRFSDIWTLPSPDDPAGRYVYCAHDDGGSGSVELYSVDAKDKWTRVNWQPATKSGMMNIRAVTHPPATLLDDPDRAAMADANAKPPGPPLLGGVNHYNSIHYGAMRASTDLYVIAFGDYGYVPAPEGWTHYSGIEVDPYYVWAFHEGGFACATHASVISCRQGKRPRPRWMVYGLNFGPNEILGENSVDGSTGDGNLWMVNGQTVRSKPPVKGLVSLFPCIDGTLTASVYRRTVTKDSDGQSWIFEATDTLDLYTADYTIDLKAGALGIGVWTKRGGRAMQVQKMPIPCWSLYESLKADLQVSSKQSMRAGG